MKRHLLKTQNTQSEAIHYSKHEMPEGRRGLLHIKPFSGLLKEIQEVYRSWVEPKEEEQDKEPVGFSVYGFGSATTHCESGRAVDNWNGVGVCTSVTIFMNHEQHIDIYLKLDRSTWPLRWFSYTRNPRQWLRKADVKRCYWVLVRQSNENKSEKPLCGPVPHD